MIQLRASASRGFADHGWLVARHSFSFADYYDPAEIGWGAPGLCSSGVRRAAAQRVAMHGGDGAKIASESAPHFVASADSEMLLFDLPH